MAPEVAAPAAPEVAAREGSEEFTMAQKKPSGPSPSCGPRDHRGGRRDRRLGSPSAAAPQAIALGQPPGLSTGDELYRRGQHVKCRSRERPVHGCYRLGRPGVGLPPGSASVSFPDSHLSFHFIGPCEVTMLLCFHAAGTPPQSLSLRGPGKMP
jgi:hypothetical protein